MQCTLAFLPGPPSQLTLGIDCLIAKLDSAQKISLGAHTLPARDKQFWAIRFVRNLAVIGRAGRRLWRPFLNTLSCRGSLRFGHAVTVITDPRLLRPKGTPLS